ncbi:MAG: helix-turn-helix domain-containing protein [Actinomycetales bacterium]|nr:helix-turn-helix domain-containing protein [Actinomycetales bacterium]
MGRAGRARRASGTSQAEVARRAGTSRPTLSAYKSGSRNPTPDTLERVLVANRQHLVSVPDPVFTRYADRRGKPFFVPDQLPRLPVEAALATVVLPPHVDWSPSGRPRNLADRSERLLAYQAVLAEGMPADILQFVDGALLVDAWADGRQRAREDSTSVLVGSSPTRPTARSGSRPSRCSRRRLIWAARVIEWGNLVSAEPIRTHPSVLPQLPAAATRHSCDGSATGDPSGQVMWFGSASTFPVVTRSRTRRRTYCCGTTSPLYPVQASPSPAPRETSVLTSPSAMRSFAKSSHRAMLSWFSHSRFI